MGTANFKKMLYDMPMVCGYLDFLERKEEYEKEFDEEYTDELYYLDCYDLTVYAQDIAENFTQELKYHDVTIQPGYYDGIQFWVEEKYSNYFDLDKNSEYCVDNADAKYYFDLYRSQVLRAAEAEKRKIEKWLETLTGNGFEILVCTGRFSDGTATYGKRENTRARIKSLC